MKYLCINVYGNFLSEEILVSVENQEEGFFQKAQDFGLDPKADLRREIEYAWSELKVDWNSFQSKYQKVTNEPNGTPITRIWMNKFLSKLGYELEFQNSSKIANNNQSYYISHLAKNIDGFPIHIKGSIEPKNPDKNTLDLKEFGGRGRFSPHGLVQEYLNVTEQLYGIVTNGLQLRVLRDSGRLIRLSYLEFDLKKMFEEDRYNDFTLMYRLIHASRFSKKDPSDESCIFEKFYQKSIESGSRIREGLSRAVKEALITLGNGFLQHPANKNLRELIQFGKLSAYDFNHELLRLIYRILFIIVTEERDLIFNKQLQINDKHKDIYYKYYSLRRIRNLSTNPSLFKSEFNDLWLGLLETFSFFEIGNRGIPMGIQSIGGELFHKNAIETLRTLKLNNSELLKCIQILNEYIDPKGNKVFINYKGLDVEEFGSIYEGLLELEAVFSFQGNGIIFEYKSGNQRKLSGSHYTPEDLVKILMKHSLEHLIHEKLEPYKKGQSTKESTISSLLKLSILDASCGSGHILLSAARRIATEIARIESDEEHPNPESLRKALRLVIQKCIYGVDKNPLSVELCKVALWIESYSPGNPLNFLDHHIKCGDAILGLASRNDLTKGIPDEAFFKSNDNSGSIAKEFKKRNNIERKEREKKAHNLDLEFEKGMRSNILEAFDEYSKFIQMPETNTEEIEKKRIAYQYFLNTKSYQFLKTMADTQLAQFFITKDKKNLDNIVTDAEYHLMLNGDKAWKNKKTEKASAIAHEQRFFHWFLEFPEVFAEGGFDCILGNPPFLGGQKLSGSFGDAYLECIKYLYAPIGAVDLVTYFFRRIFTLLKPGGFMALIATNTIAQGRAREDGLDVIVQQGGSINFAVKSIKWPGQAAVEVALVTITKQPWKGKFFLGNKEVKTITPYLDDAETTGNPYPLKQNEGKSFQGSIVLGKGFVLEPHQAEALIAKDPRNREVLFPYLNGDDLNNRPDQSPSRWVINFFDWPLEKAQTYPDCFEIVERLVKPERMAQNDKGGKEKWWQFLRPRNELYQTIAPLERVLVVARISKTVAFELLEKRKVFADALVVMPFSEHQFFSVLQSTLHNSWAWNYCTTMKSDLNYTPGQTFETFPFPQQLNPALQQKLDEIGHRYHEHRRQLMLGLQLGLTKTYNAFHSEQISVKSEKWKALLGELDNGKSLQQVDFNAYGFDKESLNLMKHFLKGEPTITLRAAVEGIEHLRTLHVQMDEAVLEAYGWTDIKLHHNFYEVDYLPENDRIRFTIHPDARKEVLKRLLQLNHKIHEEEVKAGFFNKKPKKNPNHSKKSKIKKPTIY